MNQYLLLRDNKQSGPYSVEELISKGLKPYDLVWLDGKSAAWRYPSEIAELKPFAPVVEEQPYDRFYKKPATQAITSAENIAQHPHDAHPPTSIPHSETVAVNKPVDAGNTQQVIHGKKIYVTLPAGMSRKPAPVQASETSADKAAANEENAAQAALDAALLNEKFARLREEKIRQAANKAAIPVVSDNSTFNQTVTPALPAADQKYKDLQEAGTPVFSTLVGQQQPATIDHLAPEIRFPRNNHKLVMRSIAAACLLLAGVIIGLVISNSRQRRDSEALNQLVKQIQERDRQKQEAVRFAIAETNPAAAIPSTEDAITTDLPQQPVHTPVVQKQAAAAIPVSTREESVVTKIAVPVKDVSQRQTVKVIPALISNKTEEKPAARDDAATARKNIQQQVTVDAGKYKIGVLGGISELQVTLSNNSLYPLDQVEVELRYLGPEKRVIKTQSILFNDVAAGEQKTIEAPRTNRGVSVDYVITRIHSKALGLAHTGY